MAQLYDNDYQINGFVQLQTELLKDTKNFRKILSLSTERTMQKFFDRVNFYISYLKLNREFN